MTYERNIFYRLPGKSGENFTTELLVNLLRTKFMRDIILKKLGIPEKVVENITLDHIKPQKSLEQVGIPDIRIENDESFCLIENKIRADTALQEHQLNGYISQIKNSQSANKAYIFLVPDDYHHMGHLEELKKNHNQKDGSDLIRIVCWKDLLKHLFSLEIHDESPVIKESLECLCETVLEGTSLYDEGISFSAYEVAMLYNPRDIIESFHVCDKVYEKMQLVGKDLANNKDLNIRPSRAKDEYRYNIGQFFTYKDKNTECIFIGLNTNLLYWDVEYILRDKGKEDYLFAIAFNKKCLKSSGLSMPEDYFEDDEWIYIPLNKKHLVDEQDNEALESEIEGIIRKVFLPNLPDDNL